MVGRIKLFKRYIVGEQETKKIAAFVANRENISILWLPGGGRTTFGIDLQNKNILKRGASLLRKSRLNKTRFIYVDLALKNLQLEKYLEEVLCKYSTSPALRGKISDVTDRNYLYFILDNITQNSMQTFNYILSFRSLSSSKIRFICQFLERDFFTFLESSEDIPNSLFHNVVRIPYFTKAQTLEWVKYKSKSLKIKIKESQARKLYEYCGGVPVLLSAALRNLRTYKYVDEMFSSFEMKNVIKSYWAKFSGQEKQIIGCAAYKQPLPLDHRKIDYLRIHRLLNEDNSFDKYWLKYVE